MYLERFIRKILILVIGILIFLPIFDVNKNRVQAEDFYVNNLINDGTFINTGAMDTGAIQRFLESKGSYLKDYSDGGRSAAQIIYDAAHGHGDASGSINGIDINTSTGTVNPQVILVTLQKEQSLISRTTHQDWAMLASMGYACYPGVNNDNNSNGCNDSYEGFTKQVENGAWQLRYNYERAQGHGFGDYQVGQDFCFDDWNGTHCGRFDNRATASLYRYTPHVYNGNYNFWNLFFNTYQFTTPDYSNNWNGQNGPAQLWPSEAYQFEVTFKNTGKETWQKGRVFLGTSHDRDRISRFIREGNGPSGWISPNRISMVEDSVAPGGTATFRFWMTAPNDIVAGTYREYFQLVAEGITWMEDRNVYWDVRIKNQSEKYHYEWVSQNGNPTLQPGQGYNYVVNVRNTGTITWNKGTVNLGTDRPRDHSPNFVRADLADPYGHPSNWISPNRVQMSQNSVPPGETATFSFWMSAPYNLSAGTYREHFRLVADSIGWMEDYGIYWDIKVNHPHAQWVAQSAYPSLHAGEKTAVWIEFKNTGETTWSKFWPTPINLGTDRPRDRVSRFTYSDWGSSNRISLDQVSVSPGSTGRFSFFINVPPGTPPGVYREYFRPVCDNVGWLEDYGAYFDVTVLP